jgi:hypothetical protein
MDTTPSPNPTEGRRPASRIRILTAGATDDDFGARHASTGGS